MKKFLVFLALLFLVSLLALWFLKVRTTSWFLSNKLKVDLSVGGVNLSRSKIKLENLKIRNPVGFKHEFAFICKEVIVSYKFGDLSKNPCVIEKIDLNDSQLYVDCNNAICTNNNWTQIINKVESNEAQGAEGQAKEVIINSLALNDLHVEVQGSGLVLGISKNVDIKHVDLGKVSSKEGFPTQQLIGEIFKETGLLDLLKSIINKNKIFEKFFKSLNPLGVEGEKYQIESLEGLKPAMPL